MSENLNRSFDDLTVVDSFCPTENISTLEECLKRIQILEAQNCSTSNNISQNNKSDNFTIFQQMQGRIQSLTEKNYELQIQQLQLALIEEKKKYDELKLQIENQQGGSNSLENETFNCHSNEGINILRNEIKLLRDEKAMDVEKFKEEIEKVRNEAKDKIEELIQEVNNLKTHAQQTELENTNVQQNVQENTEEIRSVDDNQAEQINASTTTDNEIVTPQVDQSPNNSSVARFVPNKWNRILNNNSCCVRKCINSNLINGICSSNNGIVHVDENGGIKYLNGTNENGFIFLLAEFPFTNALKNSIQYFEVKMNDTGVFVNFGLENTSNEQISMLFTFGVDPFRSPYFKGDIFGCGLVISPNESQESSYVFFTKNGIKIAKGDVVMIEPLERFWPSIGLQSCSIESTNFGNDLVTKPFCYDISKHV